MMLSARLFGVLFSETWSGEGAIGGNAFRFDGAKLLSVGGPPALNQESAQ